MIILLDAGHGGMHNGNYVTPGKRSPIWADGTQYFEGIGNRDIRDRIAALLKKQDIEYYFVTAGQDDVSLAERVRVINNYCTKYSAKNCLVISIHSDAFDKPTATGWSCYTTKGATNSDKYAEALYCSMRVQFPNATFRTDGADGDQDKEEGFYIIKNANCPAILSENFFMTNETECKEILMTATGRQKIAQAHVDMILKFIK